MTVLNNPGGRQDRRRGESTLPVGFFERRHNPERRLPEMEVMRLSDMDWQKYFGPSSKPSET